MPPNHRNNKHLPFVSICTPTFNRRPFFPFIIKCFENQTYPKNRMEWIIIDDGTDKIEDIVRNVPQIKYFKYDEKMTLGKKRNLSHEKAKGDIIIYMDDDDYYPPERVSHAVDMLQKNPTILCAGSSEMYIYFKHIQQMYQFGPYGPNHATAASFAFRKELLKQTKYEENASVAEEKHFLKGYTIPLVQLDPMKTILVFSHTQNSFDKKELLNGPPNPTIKVSTKLPSDFVKESDILSFFMEGIDKSLETYDLGKPEHKPDVIKQLDEIKKSREKMQQDHLKKQQEMEIMNQPIIQAAQKQLNELASINQSLKNENNQLKDKMKYLEDKMKQLIMAQIQERVKLSTVVSTTVVSTTVDSTTVDSTTVDSTTVDSTTVDSTTVVSTTVDSTTVDSNI
jgi:hypothetical protein